MRKYCRDRNVVTSTLWTDEKMMRMLADEEIISTCCILARRDG